MKSFFQRLLVFIISVSGVPLTSFSQNIPGDFLDPPREFSVMPFWFWNDTLKDEEIIRQIADMEDHGVYGFVIHPRIGLPEKVKWLGDEMIHSMSIAIAEAEKRNMYVILYDEGMYPSGSSGGQVVAANPEHAARGLAKIDLKEGEKLQLTNDQRLVTIINRPDGSRVAVIDKYSGGVIRGIHYIGEGATDKPGEESPPAGDILNPDAVTSFIDLVYEKYVSEFGKYFGKTVIGIFTDEPSPMGRGAARGLMPGNAKLIPQVNKILGYDITSHLADLWYDDYPESKKHRADYNAAINISLEENYYKRLGSWCAGHGISLIGHPAGSMDIGAERYFQIPGQDLVWRYVEPGEKALRGEHSTMAKCASSAMLHLGAERNANELYGAYGHNLTFDEMKWLASWCFVRGQNLLIPHAFYYSIRGPRFDERPPDVGPNASWWKDFRQYADACRRLSWLNTGSEQICGIAVIGEATWLPWRTPEILFKNQKDFNYLEIRHLSEDAVTDSEGVHIAAMNYRVVIIDSLSTVPEVAKPSLKKLADAGRLLIWNNESYRSIFSKAIFVKDPQDLLAAVSKLVSTDLVLSPASESIRYRHIVKEGVHYYIIFNEEENVIRTRISTPLKGKCYWLDPSGAELKKYSPGKESVFQPHELRILMIR